MTIVVNDEEFNLEQLMLGDARMMESQRPFRDTFTKHWNRLLSDYGWMEVPPPIARDYSKVPSGGVYDFDEKNGKKDALLRLNGINYKPELKVRHRAGPKQGTCMPHYLTITVPQRSQRCGCGLPAPHDHCPICTNMLDAGFAIYRENQPVDTTLTRTGSKKHVPAPSVDTPKSFVRGYIVGPNQNPIGINHSLLVSENKRGQDSLHEGDIRTAMEFSYMMQQFMIYNMPTTGGTVPHLHFQGFDYDMAGHRLPLQVLLDGARDELIKPAFLENIVVDQFTIANYPGDNMFFVGTNAPQNAKRYLDSLGHGAAYNILIDRDIVGVIPREVLGVRAPATNSIWAGLELWGGIVVGDITDKKGKVLVEADIVADSLDYTQINNNLRHGLKPKRDHYPCPVYTRHQPPQGGCDKVTCPYSRPKSPLHEMLSVAAQYAVSNS